MQISNHERVAGIDGGARLAAEFVVFDGKTYVQHAKWSK
jgi:hypothetical protein